MKKIFINYSADADDRKLFETLYLHLGIIRDFEIWHPGKIKPGADIRQELDLHFSQSEIVLPMLSVNYLNDNDCMKEFNAAVEQRKKLYPLLISSFDIDSCDALKSKEMEANLIPEDKSFIETSQNLDAACMMVCKELRSRVLGAKQASPKLLTTDSRRFLYLLAILPIVLGLGYGAWCFLNDQVSTITYIGSLLIISISLFPIIKLLLPDSAFHKYA